VRELLFFDLEATGVDPYADRIVEVAMFDWQGREVLNTLVNPGVAIPEDATEVHGITDLDVADAPTIAQLAPEIERAVDGKILAGYNSVRYDTPLLDAELQRAGRTGLPRDESGAIAVREIDLFAVWKQAEPRTLVSAARRFAGVDLENAHRAGADAEVLPLLLRTMVDEIVDLSHGDPYLTKLEELSRPDWMLDRDGKFRREEDGTVVFGFGKHQGSPAHENPDYIRWMLRKDFSPDTKAWCRRLLSVPAGV
jgi:DNA polymerase III subunit epsilon